MTVNLIQQDSNWDNFFVLCSDSAGEVMQFLTDWAADIDSGEFRVIDAIWQTI